MISLFSGAMGLDLGFMAAGFEVRFANDISKDSSRTITKNLPNVEFCEQDIAQVSSEDILSRSGLEIGEVDLLVGGPPCQPFSTAGKREGLNDPHASPLREYIRVIKDIQPRYFVMEEVEGILFARLKHISIAERKKRDLLPEEKKGTVFKVILEMLNSTGYNFQYKLVNSAEYGTPQVRKRLIILGMRDGAPVYPRPTHSNTRDNIEDESPLQTYSSLWDACVDLQGKEQEYNDLSEKRQKYMEMVVPGGNWRHLPSQIIEEAMGGAYSSGGGKMGYFRRLSWDEPSPTVVTSPSQKSTMLYHPYQNRTLSVEEYKRVQGFPDDWKIIGETSAKYTLIGDAVPVHLSYSIALSVYDQILNQKKQ